MLKYLKQESNAGAASLPQENRNSEELRRVPGGRRRKGGKVGMEQENRQEFGPQAELPLSEGAYPFRGVAFGGFSRQDVLDYLKKLQDFHRKEQSSLQEALATAHTREEAQRQQAQESERAREEAAREAREQSLELERVREALLEAQGALERAEAERDELQALAARAEEELAQLRPQAEAYLQLRERTATIEIDAHAYAQSIIDKAQKESARVREAYIGWVRKMHAEYQELHEDTGLTFGKLTQELERVCRSLERMAGELDLHEEEIEAFLLQVEQEEPEGKQFP